MPEKESIIITTSLPEEAGKKLVKFVNKLIFFNLSHFQGLTLSGQIPYPI